MDRERKITLWNQTAEEVTEYRSKKIVGNFCYDKIRRHVEMGGNEQCRNGCPLKKNIEDRENREAEVFLQHREGHRVPVKLRVAPIKDEKGAISGAVEIFHDNSEMVSLMGRLEELEELSMIDEITECPNRRFLEMSIHSRCEEMRRYGRSFGLLFVDIDKFKSVNDTHGHHVGDRVLSMVSNTLSGTLRPFDIVGRWGGDEFLVIVVNVGETDVLVVAWRWRSMVEQSGFSENGVPLKVTVSVGAALALEGESEEEIVKRADRMMYMSKTTGGNRVTTDG